MAFFILFMEQKENGQLYTNFIIIRDFGNVAVYPRWVNHWKQPKGNSLIQADSPVEEIDSWIFFELASATKLCTEYMQKNSDVILTCKSCGETLQCFAVEDSCFWPTFNVF